MPAARVIILGAMVCCSTGCFGGCFDLDIDLSGLFCDTWQVEFVGDVTVSTDSGQPEPAVLACHPGWNTAGCLSVEPIDLRQESRLAMMVRPLEYPSPSFQLDFQLDAPLSVGVRSLYLFRGTVYAPPPDEAVSLRDSPWQVEGELDVEHASETLVRGALDIRVLHSGIERFAITSDDFIIRVYYADCRDGVVLDGPVLADAGPGPDAQPDAPAEQAIDAPDSDATPDTVAPDLYLLHSETYLAPPDWGQ